MFNASVENNPLICISKQIIETFCQLHHDCRQITTFDLQQSYFVNPGFFTALLFFLIEKKKKKNSRKLFLQHILYSL